jgi:histidine triad (HIT) family protein
VNISSECIFCKIVAGAIPSSKVHEDAVCLAIMDIGPLAEGHVLLIPKSHAETIDQLDAKEAGEMLKNLPRLVTAVRNATGCQGVNVLQNNGRAAHQLVPHVHFHIIPRNAGDEFHFNWPAKPYLPGRMEQVLAAIRGSLK